MSITITNITVANGSRFSGYDASPPSQPLNVTAATNAGGQATISFNPPVSDGGTNILNYTIVSDPSGLTQTGGASPITINGLNNGGTSYVFRVFATNEIGPGPLSDPSNSVTPILVSSQVQFTSVGTTNWTVPAGVTSISIVAVGAGGQRGGSETYYPGGIGTAQENTGGGGGGAGLAYTNNVSVTPGQVLTINVGGTGSVGTDGAYGVYSNGQSRPTTYATDGSDGGNSYVIVTGSTVVEAGGGLGGGGAPMGSGGLGGYGGTTVTGDGGGSGGRGGGGTTAGTAISYAGGGGGAGGYSGNGGNGGVSTTSSSTVQAGTNGTGGGGGGGHGAFYYATGSGGGGVGLLGEGTSGNGGRLNLPTYTLVAGGGGSNGSGGKPAYINAGGGIYNASGGTGQYGSGGSDLTAIATAGAVRIIWGNSSYTRSFPSTNTGNV